MDQTLSGFWNLMEVDTSTYQLVVSVRDMDRSLDIVALRSLVGVADYGGFHRAAEVLRVSQSAVSQHVRRLEKVVGRPLVERRGRRAVFTADGQALLGEARRILAAHDGALRRLVGVEVPAVSGPRKPPGATTENFEPGRKSDRSRIRIDQIPISPIGY
jgi:molybdenum-dependent DNA-binding transcriptional regulator ModE